MNKRVFLVILDACGIGAMPDWKEYDDPEGANTIVNVASYYLKETGKSLNIPNLQKMGLGNIADIPGVPVASSPIAKYGKLAETAPGKDTTTGHWEIAGLTVEKPFPVYPKGFPGEINQEFIKQSGCKDILCNLPYSGTKALDDYGQEHLDTGFPIIYTSADSVYQIATHTDVTSLETLYNWCELAREILRDKHEVSRVIARPFAGKPGEFYRLSEARHDYAVEPTGETLLTHCQKHNTKTISIGKIIDIFCEVGLDEVLEGKSNAKCLEHITERIQNNNSQQNEFYFANLVETDSHFGHRNDPMGFAKALELIDIELGKWLDTLGKNDLLILTADHGCDPTVPSTDHNREYIPCLAYSPGIIPGDINTRETFADHSASIAEFLGLSDSWQQTKTPGTSYL